MFETAMTNQPNGKKNPKKSTIRAVLFDLDDTLWPIVPVILRAESMLFDWLRNHAPAVPARFSMTSLRERRRELMASQPRYTYDLTALRYAGLHEAFTACGEDCAKIEQAMAVFAQARNEVTPFEDVATCLPRLANHVRLGSLTNGGADLQTIGLAHHFDVSLAAHQIGCAKPDPAIFHTACDVLGLAPAEVAYVGDDLVLDVEGAQRAGLHGIWMNRAGGPAKAEHSYIEPDASCQSLYELESWLLAHNDSLNGSTLG